MNTYAKINLNFKFQEKKKLIVLKGVFYVPQNINYYAKFILNNILIS